MAHPSRASHGVECTKRCLLLLYSSCYLNGLVALVPAPCILQQYKRYSAAVVHIQLPYKATRFKKGSKPCQGFSDRMNAMHALRTSSASSVTAKRWVGHLPRSILLVFSVMFRNDVYEPTHKLNPGRTFYT